MYVYSLQVSTYIQYIYIYTRFNKKEKGFLFSKKFLSLDF